MKKLKKGDRVVVCCASPFVGTLTDLPMDRSRRKAKSLWSVTMDNGVVRNVRADNVRPINFKHKPEGDDELPLR